MTRTLRALLPRPEEVDRALVLAVFLLCLLGMVMVFGAGSFRVLAVGGGWDHTHYLIKHVVRLLLGTAALVALFNIDYRRFRGRRLGWLLAGGALALVALPVVAVRAGAVSHGACWRWYDLGLFPVQPLEVAKIGLVLLLARILGEPAAIRRPGPPPAADGPAAARLLARLREGAVRLAALRPGGVPLTALAVPAGMVVLLALQPNYGNALLMALVTAVMLFAAGISLRFLAAVAGLVAGAAGLAFLLVPKVTYRVGIWLSGLAGGEVVYQVHQSLLGLGAGGWHGVGVGGSHQRFWFLPESHTDFIFAVLGEELGLLGTLAVLALFLVFAVRGLGIAARAAEPFGRLAATGLTALIFLYVAANLAMVVGLFPVIGVPLPFVSYGGSALVTNLAAVGILLNIDRQGRAYQQWRSRWHRLPGLEGQR